MRLAGILIGRPRETKLRLGERLQRRAADT